MAAALRPPPPPDRGTLWVILACALAVALGIAHIVMAGCAARVECPLGTYAQRTRTRSTHAGTASAVGSLPREEVSAGGTWRGSDSTEYECTPICPPFTAPKLHISPRGQRLECVDLVAAKRGPGGAATPDGGTP